MPVRKTPKKVVKQQLTKKQIGAIIGSVMVASSGSAGVVTANKDAEIKRIRQDFTQKIAKQGVSLENERLIAHGLRKRYVLQSQCLGSDPVVDISLGTLEEWQDSYLQSASDLGIDLTKDINTKDIISVMRAKLKLADKRCVSK